MTALAHTGRCDPALIEAARGGDAEARLVHLPVEELRIDLSRAIQSLPDHYREVILLRDIEELSIDEIAGVLGLTRESVKARIHRARLMIREYLVRD